MRAIRPRLAVQTTVARLSHLCRHGADIAQLKLTINPIAILHAANQEERDNR